MLAIARPAETAGQLYRAIADAGIPAAGLDFYQTPEWFANLADNCLEPGESVYVVCAGQTVLPLRIRRAKLGLLFGTEARGLLNFYSCRFAPPGLEMETAPVSAAHSLGQALKGAGHARLRFGALSKPACRAMATDLASAGWLTEPFRQFGNWYLNTENVTFQDYWASRPGQLRNTGRRRR